MRAKLLLIAAAALLWGAPGAPAFAQKAAGLRERSPADLYEALYWSNAGPRCYPADDPYQNDRLRARFAKVRPWLVAQIGEKEFEALVEGLDEQVHGVYFIRCPSEPEQRRDTRRRLRVLEEMERRAKAAR
ncbi:MAG: hypothetical protein V4574_08710 [Pseudomonadota bacterium]